MIQPSGWVITIHGTRTKYGTNGFDSMLFKVPGHWYTEISGSRCLVGAVVGAELRALSHRGAAGVGEKLHHADWVLTSDRRQVEQIGMTHDCVKCREGTDRALAALAAEPGAEIAAGLLYWAGDRPRFGGGTVEVEGVSGMYRRRLRRK